MSCRGDCIKEYVPAGDEVSIFADIEDRDELDKMVKKEKGIRYHDVSILTEGAWGYLVEIGLTFLLSLILDWWLTKRRGKKTVVLIRRKDGTSVRVESAGDLKLYIDEMKKHLGHPK